MRRRNAATGVVIAMVVVGACAPNGDQATSTPVASTTVADGSDDGGSDPVTSSTVVSPSTTVDTTAEPDPTPPATPPAGPVSTGPTSTLTPATTLGGVTIAPPATIVVTVPTTTELDAAALADIERASTALLTINDFPDGWIAEPPAPSADDDVYAARVDACFGRAPGSPTEVLEARRADSDDFAGPDESRPTVEHSVTVAPDEGIALLAMAEVGTNGASECLVGVVQEYFEAELAADIEELDGVTIGQITIDRIDDGSAPDTEVGYRLQIPLVLDGERFVQYLDVLYTRQGRALSNLQFASFLDPFDAETYEALRDVSISRLGRIGS